MDAPQGRELPLPTDLAECDADQCTKPGGHAGTWVFHGMTGVARQGPDSVADLTIERFDTEAIIIRRAERPSSKLFGLTAVYQGRMRDGRIDGTMYISWPGVVPPNVTVSWFAVAPRTSCENGASLTPLDAREAGVMALRFQHNEQAFQCFRAGAEQGDGLSKVYFGAMYANGTGTRQDYATALRWLENSAVQGELVGQWVVAQWYELGVGTSPDPEKAEKWWTTLKRNPVYLKHQQELEQLRINGEINREIFETIREVVTNLSAR
jgi:hypothetical protein